MILVFRNKHMIVRLLIIIIFSYFKLMLWTYAQHRFIIFVINFLFCNSDVFWILLVFIYVPLCIYFSLHEDDLCHFSHYLFISLIYPPQQLNVWTYILLLLFYVLHFMRFFDSYCFWIIYLYLFTCPSSSWFVSFQVFISYFTFFICFIQEIWCLIACTC